jgi:hypothetical protein
MLVLYTDRATDQNIDYTDYLFVGQYVPFYICDGVTNYTAVASAGTCQAPDMYVAHTGSTEVTTHEVRISGDINDTTSFTAGVFLSDLEMIEHNEFTYPGSAKLDTKYSPNYPHTNPQAWTRWKCWSWLVFSTWSLQCTNYFC